MRSKIKSIEEILRTHGPMLSSDVSKFYREQGLSEAAARQRVSRRPREVKTLYGLPFPQNTKFLFLDTQFGTYQFYQILIKKLQETSPAYSSAISGLSSRQGLCLAKHWDIVSCSPVLQKRHIASKEVLTRLKSVKLFSELNIEGIGNCITFSKGSTSLNYAAFRSRLVLEYILIETIKNWSIRVGFSPKNSISTRNDTLLPKFSTHCFDIVSASYLHSLTEKKAGSVKNGFFVADVVWSDEMNESDVSGYLRKISTLSALRNLGRFQPMLVSNSFTTEALMQCRSKGVMAVTPDTLFGRDVAKSLVELFDVLKRAAGVAINSPEKIENLFDKLSIIDGLTGNLRGALFEMIVGNIVKDLYAGSIDIGVIVTDHQSNNKADIDVRLVKTDAIVCFECKGYSSNREVTLKEVEYWLEKQVPIIRASQKYEQRFSGLRASFEFWTTGSFEEAAVEYLKKKQHSIKKYDINWRDGQYVLEQSEKLSTNTIRKILKTHYFKQTLSSVIEK